MTVGQLKQILADSGLSDDTPVYLGMDDDTKRDGTQEVFIYQVESDCDLGLTIRLHDGKVPYHPALLTTWGKTY